ncbi:hypothetical protein NLI96_g11711 [Meripilus lineatus]|uniref:TATA-box-binding protein n=1 Tax=Meripilus lineatus TaxID=2056292 RepID=A0AAD5URB5_9APHY|nr:hypothetical protein NLI96_g11711 [Physisporinus lineatus]
MWGPPRIHPPPPPPYLRNPASLALPYPILRRPLLLLPLPRLNPFQCPHNPRRLRPTLSLRLVLRHPRLCLPLLHHSLLNISPLIVPTLQNIVATVNLDCRLDLKTIVLHARNAEYNPKRFAAIIMRIRDPKTTALIFASGKMVVMGAPLLPLSRPLHLLLLRLVSLHPGCYTSPDSSVPGISAYRQTPPVGLMDMGR